MRSFFNVITNVKWRGFNRNTSRKEAIATSSSKLDDIPCFLGNPGSIAVNIHVFYPDIFDEIIRHLKNMPYKYDLFITVNNAIVEELISRKIDNLGPFLGTCKIVVIPNRGRDISSLVATFANDIIKYDYVCHLHTKKSLSSQIDGHSWRRYLFKNCMGSSVTIRRIFGIFSSFPDVGIVYPQTYKEILYWGHTWLSNKAVSASLLRQLHIDVNLESYVDCPTGSMFWARTKYLKPLLKLGLDSYDFPEEAGQSDGTLAHAIERTFVLVVKSCHGTFVEMSVDRNFYSKSFADKNLSQYFSQSKEGLLNGFNLYDVISFDIFDTLLTRIFYYPDAIFSLIEHKLYFEWGLKLKFLSIRKRSEALLRRKAWKGDVTIHEIYEEIARMAGLTQELSDKIKNLEIDLECRFSHVRPVMVDLMNQAKSRGKRVILTSDMYLTKDIIEFMLRKNNIINYDCIYISCEFKKRKDKGELWDYIREVECKNGERLLHIGDDEYSDVQIPGSKGICPYHIFSPRIAFENSRIGANIDRLKDKTGWATNAFIGIIVNKEYNDPFVFGAKRFSFFNDYTDFGYAVLGPICFGFMSRLITLSMKHEVKTIYFLSREGFFLKKIYDAIILRKDNWQKIGVPAKSQYLLCSRRANEVASLYNLDDIERVLRCPYKGTISDLFDVRFGLGADFFESELSSYGIVGGQKISLPDDIDKIRAIAYRISDKIFAHASIERGPLLNYCRKSGLMSKEAYWLVGVGYSGTIQHSLSRILNKALHGYYMMTTNGIIMDKYNKYDSCFAKRENWVTTKIPLMRYSLLFESIFTSPDGQLIKFIESGDNVIPVFGPVKETQKNRDHLEKIINGVISYAMDIIDLFGPEILQAKYNFDDLQYFYECVIQDKIMDEQLKEIFTIEDVYGGAGELSVWDFYKKLGLIQ
jgi:FMN phosphatase YigB (HAD superfamily)